jgi:deoxyribonuclease V
MKIHRLHSWSLTPKEAVVLQRELAGRVDARAPLTRCELVAGADASYDRVSDVLYAGVVVVRAEDGIVVEQQQAVQRVSFPYVPGLLAFREAPALLEAFAKVQSEPEAVMLDGQGYAHPRRLGLACLVGLWLDRPCLGCAKSVLVGTYKEPGLKAGALAPLRHRDEVVGSVVRTKTGIKPVFVSVGHKIDLPSAVRVVLQNVHGYRIPEATRQAHLLVNAIRRAAPEPPESGS